MAVVARITLFMNRASNAPMDSPRRGEVIGRSLTPSSIEFLSIACGRGNNLSRPMDSLGEQTARLPPRDCPRANRARKQWPVINDKKLEKPFF